MYIHIFRIFIILWYYVLYSLEFLPVNVVSENVVGENVVVKSCTPGSSITTHGSKRLVDGRCELFQTHVTSEQFPTATWKSRNNSSFQQSLYWAGYVRNLLTKISGKTIQNFLYYAALQSCDTYWHRSTKCVNPTQKHNYTQIHRIL